MYELIAITLYFILLLFIGVFSYSKNLTPGDFVIGNRSLNYWMTALAAHASDMSSWLFMAYPAMIFTFGLSKSWIAIGLIIFMYLNWHFVAPKIRIKTGQYNNLTFFAYLENRFGDKSGLLRSATAIICILFYTIYISAGLVGLGLLIESLFDISYGSAIGITLLIAIPYVLIGGYKTLAKIDLFQGIFLLLVIAIVPLLLFNKIEGLPALKSAAQSGGVPLTLVADWSIKELAGALLVMMGWGLGYFGQPAIITKFMGIKNPCEISKSKYVGMSWMIISLFAATFVGLLGFAFFGGPMENPEMIFIELVKANFHPFWTGLILCAIFAASINVLSSQMLVLSSSISEDLYRRYFRKEALPAEILIVSRTSIVGIALIAFFIAYFKISTIYSLVLYAWSGLGSAFGPLLIYSLYSERRSPSIAWSAILSGSLCSALWPYFNRFLVWPVDPIVIGFGMSLVSIWIASRLSKKDVEEPLTDSAPSA